MKIKQVPTQMEMAEEILDGIPTVRFALLEEADHDQISITQAALRRKKSRDWMENRLGRWEAELATRWFDQ